MAVWRGLHRLVHWTTDVLMSVCLVSLSLLSFQTWTALSRSGLESWRASVASSVLPQLLYLVSTSDPGTLQFQVKFQVRFYVYNKLNLKNIRFTLKTSTFFEICILKGRIRKISEFSNVTKINNLKAFITLICATRCTIKWWSIF